MKIGLWCMKRKIDNIKNILKESGKDTSGKISKRMFKKIIKYKYSLILG